MAKSLMEFSYYPGCSLHSTASEYNASVEGVFSELNARLHELEDWNCCGASSAHIFNHELSLALPARNLAIAQQAGRDILMPCAACFNRHKTADFEMRRDPDRRVSMEGLVDFKFTGEVQVRPLLDVIVNEIGLEEIQAHVTRPLSGFKAVGYYGCLLVRPPEVTQFDHPENPQLMNRLLEALGAQAMAWSHATDCCGGGLSLTKTDITTRLVSRLAERAREAGAEAIVTSCPLCQVNLEMRQAGRGQKMPVFYFTELIGLAFGMGQVRGWLKKHLIDPLPVLERANLAP
jgi:heterodisulfide reductase subunit B2